MAVRIHIGDCRDVLKTLADESVHCVVTSPPYFGLRDYGVDGQIGLEPTPGEFVHAMVEVFREVRRVLRNDGTLWLNLGDSYAAGGNGGHQRSGKQGESGQMADRRVAKAREINRKTPSFHGHSDRGIADRTGIARKPPAGLKHKDLMGIPWRVAFALQADGWYLRQDIIWNKPNPMPESVTDRCTKAHEYLFLLSKSSRYHFDGDAICEPATFEGPNGRQQSPHAQGFARRSPKEEAERRIKRSGNKARKPGSARGCPENTGSNVCGSVPWEGVTRNKRSVWSVATQPFSEAHFATFPPALIEPCILAGCPTGGLVLDPFGGAGTTGLVAERLQRNSILIELNPEYAAMAERRIRNDAPMLADVRIACAK